jgi:hypothetical protein
MASNQWHLYHVRIEKAHEKKMPRKKKARFISHVIIRTSGENYSFLG